MVCVKRCNKETIVKKRKNKLLPNGKHALFMCFCVFRILGKFKFKFMCFVLKYNEPNG